MWYQPNRLHRNESFATGLAHRASLGARCALQGTHKSPHEASTSHTGSPDRLQIHKKTRQTWVDASEGGGGARCCALEADCTAAVDVTKYALREKIPPPPWRLTHL